VIADLMLITRRSLTDHDSDGASAGRLRRNEAIEFAHQPRNSANAAYLLRAIARTVWLSQDDGAETQSGLRADPGAVPGASTLAA
jgi:hypothetical protein